MLALAVTRSALVHATHAFLAQFQEAEALHFWLAEADRTVLNLG